MHQLEIEDLDTFYDETHVLRSVSMQSKGQVVALLGRNGAGKTTLMRSIMGLTPARAGRIMFEGVNITREPPYRIAQRGIGFVPQGRKIFPSLTVKENLTMAQQRRGRGMQWDLDDVYSVFPILKERAKIGGALLSGGEQQMLAIGRALMTNPKLLLMDEPSEGLAPKVIEDIGRVIRQLKEADLAIVLVEQNLKLALSVADYVYVIDRGTIVHEAPAETFGADQAAKASYLGVA